MALKITRGDGIHANGYFVNFGLIRTLQNEDYLLQRRFSHTKNRTTVLHLKYLIY